MTRFGEKGCHKLNLEELNGKVFIHCGMWYLQYSKCTQLLWITHDGYFKPIRKG